MEIFVGTSGFGYAAWKGKFYPARLPPAKMLAYYAGKFSTVEVNNTFYAMPTPAQTERWGADTPPGFRFAFKCPQSITHRARLQGVSVLVSRLFDSLSVLGRKLGPVLFQLPPSFRADVSLLRDFLDLLPERQAAAFEFRHDSWLTDPVFTMLHEANAALCVADTDDATTPWRPTADWGYLRLRREDYSEKALAGWADRIQGERWEQAFVFFKHEDEAKGPRLAARFEERFLDADSHPLAVALEEAPEAPDRFA